MADRPTSEAVAALYHKGGWTAAEGDAISAPLSAPSVGPPPGHPYPFGIRTAFAVATAET